MKRSTLLVCVLFGCASPPEGEEEAPLDPGDPPVDTETPPIAEPGVDADGDGHDAGPDCDDADPDVFPGAPDRCGDDRVTDCDRVTETGLVTVDGDETFTSLQDALDAAVPGSEVRVCAGTFPGPFVAPVPVTLLAHDDVIAVLDGGDSGTTLSVPGGSSVIGLTLTGGLANVAGGLLQTSEGSLELRDCRVIDNEATHGGGIALATSSVVTVANTVVEDNSAYSGGGGGIRVAAGTSLDLTGSTVSGNGAQYGGGVFLDEGSSLVGGEIHGNESNGCSWLLTDPGGGGGVSTYHDVAITGTVIAGNRACFGSGFTATYGTLVLTDVQVMGNTFLGLGAYGAGGMVAYGRLELVGTSEIVENVNGDDAPGGGLDLLYTEVVGGRIARNHGGYGGGVRALDSILTGVVIEDNEAVVEGGGIAAEWGPLTVTGGAILGNHARRGGGVSVMDAGATFDGVTISDNSADEGGGLHLTSWAEVDLVSSTLARNSATIGGGVLCDSTGLELSSIGSDWGVDVDDNVPEDVWIRPTGAFTGYGADATFACDETCTP